MEQSLESRLYDQLNSERLALAEAVKIDDPSRRLIARKQIALTAMALAGLHGRELTDYLPELIPVDYGEVPPRMRQRAGKLGYLAFASASPYSGDDQGLIEAIASGAVAIAGSSVAAAQAGKQ